VHGIDALLEIKSNPTSFQDFEVRYTTKGQLRIAAISVGDDIRYSVDVSGTLPILMPLQKASREINVHQMRQLRDIFSAAQTKLASLSQ